MRAGQLFESGRRIAIWPYALGLLIGLPLLAALAFGAPGPFEVPELKGFNFAGGSRVIPEFVALTLALSTYTARLHRRDRARRNPVGRTSGQMEAGASLGLPRGSTLRLIVVPQALRVILPPLTNQYLNLTKNSSLAVAIGYPDLVSVFAGTTLSQTGQAIEIIAITMGVYLADFAGDQRDHELLRMADRQEPAADERSRCIVVRSPGTGSGARRAGQDHRPGRIFAHPAVQFADQHPAHAGEPAAAVVHRSSRP